jgi:hypothetical protein
LTFFLGAAAPRIQTVGAHPRHWIEALPRHARRRIAAFEIAAHAAVAVIVLDAEHPHLAEWVVEHGAAIFCRAVARHFFAPMNAVGRVVRREGRRIGGTLAKEQVPALGVGGFQIQPHRGRAARRVEHDVGARHHIQTRFGSANAVFGKRVSEPQ